MRDIERQWWNLNRLADQGLCHWCFANRHNGFSSVMMFCEVTDKRPRDWVWDRENRCLCRSSRSYWEVEVESNQETQYSGKLFATSLYTWKLADVPSWSGQKRSPASKGYEWTTEDSTINLIKTSNGWEKRFKKGYHGKQYNPSVPFAGRGAQCACVLLAAWRLSYMVLIHNGMPVAIFLTFGLSVILIGHILQLGLLELLSSPPIIAIVAFIACSLEAIFCWQC